jgi:hypothetical protein
MVKRWARAKGNTLESAVSFIIHSEGQSRCKLKEARNIFHFSPTPPLADEDAVRQFRFPMCRHYHELGRKTLDECIPHLILVVEIPIEDDRCIHHQRH